MLSEKSNQDLSGLGKNMSALPRIKTLHAIKYFYGSILGLGSTGVHLYSLFVPMLPLTLEKQALDMRTTIQSSVHPNILAINQV